MRRTDLLTRAVVFAVVVVLSVGTVSAGVPVHAVTGAAVSPTPISSCTTITEPGDYVLIQDLEANGSADACLRIDVNETVVIDGQGHSIEGGIDVGANADEEDIVSLELSDATVDTIRYPEGGLVGPYAAGRLENVTVETIELGNVDGLTIESSHVENDITGNFAQDVTLRNSTFEGGVEFHENAVRFDIRGNTFAEEVIFHENLLEGTIVDNEFSAGLTFLSAGGATADVRIADNRFSLEAEEVAGFESGGIVFTAGERNVVENNSITVEGNVSGGEFGSNGIFLSGAQNVVRGNAITGADNGIFLTGTDDNHIHDNSITGNDVGVRIGGFGNERSTDRIENNEIVENRVGVHVISDNANVTFERNVVANNTEFGVLNVADGGFVFDARNNYWGASDGPSSAPADDSDAPFEDPVTGALADGTGDGVSEGPNPGVSNVRFDPFLTESPNETDDGEQYYQVDFVTGHDVIETFGPADSDRFYSDQGRLVRFLHGSTSTPVERVGSVTTLDENASCIQVESFDVSGDTATVRYTVPEDCQIREGVTLVSYEKPGPGWSRATASEQRLVDVDRGDGSNPGTYVLTVTLPTASSTADTANQTTTDSMNGLAVKVADRNR